MSEMFCRTHLIHSAVEGGFLLTKTVSTCDLRIYIKAADCESTSNNANPIDIGERYMNAVSLLKLD
jgi:hypothetical protein